MAKWTEAEERRRGRRKMAKKDMERRGKLFGVVAASFKPVKLGMHQFFG